MKWARRHTLQDLSFEQDATLESNDPYVTPVTLSWWLDHECFGVTSGALHVWRFPMIDDMSQKKTNPSAPPVTKVDPSDDVRITLIWRQCLFKMATASPVGILYNRKG